ncbi:cupin domain-containing protein [Saccharopolyspora shandongensis]|uniref:cupin domain-containing protein n=1 Tax=Saccharopolyspora shandongensis TaxID=418495 RepID=UPI0034230576
MSDTTIIKVDGAHSPRGSLGQYYLAEGVGLAMRLWREEPPGVDKESATRDYETAGYVISGRAELHSEGQTVLLEPGDSWIIPRGAEHRYNIIETFTAVEATHPPAQVHGRDEKSG